MFKTTIVIFSEFDPAEGEFDVHAATALVFSAFIGEDVLGPVTIEKVDERNDPDFPEDWLDDGMEDDDFEQAG